MCFSVDWMLEYQGMVCLAGNQVWWTWEVEDVFRKVKKGAKTALKDYAKRLHGQIDKLVVKVRAEQGCLRSLMSRSWKQHKGRTLSDIFLVNIYPIKLKLIHVHNFSLDFYNLFL